MAVKTGTIKVANRVRTTTRVAIVARAMAFAGCCFLAVACSNGRDPSVARTHEAAPIVSATRASDPHRGDTAFDRVFALRPNDVAARYDRGRSHEALHHWRAAEADLRYVASRRPAWSNARYALGIARFHRHHYAVAASDFDRVMRKGLRDGTVALDAGISYSKLHQWSTAIARFRTAVSDRPRSGRARFGSVSPTCIRAPSASRSANYCLLHDRAIAPCVSTHGARSVKVSGRRSPRKNKKKQRGDELFLR